MPLLLSRQTYLEPGLHAPKAVGRDLRGRQHKEPSWVEQTWARLRTA